jgi:4-hydroxy-tetrahydrodipicolinate synthase
MFTGSLVAIVTPMRLDGSVDPDAWDRLLDWHLAAGTAGVVIGGTTGESVTLSDAELGMLVARAPPHGALRSSPASAAAIRPPWPSGHGRSMRAAPTRCWW